MSIERRVQLVKNLFTQLEQESVQFQLATGLSCVSGCGKCCSHPEVEASPLEFLPWAFHVFLDGQAEITLNSLNNTTAPICYLYKSLTPFGMGNCSSYTDRGLICHLFGYAANTDKYDKLRLATCTTIKDGQSENYNKTVDAISNGLSVPVFTEYYMQLNQIDFRLGNMMLPINKALIYALEEVLQYYAYRPIPVMEKVS